MREVTPERAQSLDFVVAKQKELASWVACHVYDLVPDNGQKAISCRWVLVDKVQDDGSLKPKARLVVRGFQEAGLRDLDTFSPTCSKSSWRVLLKVASYRGLAPITVDISTAFLQGGALQREVYVRPPQQLHAPGQLLKLRKAVYGLVDAPLYWYQALHKAMLSIGVIVVPFDLAIYLYGIMRIFVDGQPFTLTISPSQGRTVLSHPFWRCCTVSSLLGLKKERSMCFVEWIWNANVTMTAI